MVTIKQIIDAIEEFAPLATQAPYDNCGLKIGDPQAICTGVMITLDLSESVVEQAVNNRCNLIIEHHPSIWKGWKNIDLFYPKTKALLTAFQNDIVVYSAHTNVDFAPNGLNDAFAEQILLTDLQEEPEGRIGTLQQGYTLSEYARIIGKILKDDTVRTIGNPEKIIHTVAVINGAGGGDEELLADFSRKSDVFVTAEVKYNVARLSKDIDYAIIEVGHFTSELGFMPLIRKVLHKTYPNIAVYEAVIPDPYE